MDMPTDRGYAVISSSEDGMVTVGVGTAIENGRIVGVYAQHVRVPGVRIDPAVRLVTNGSYRYTTKIVEVFSADGAVNIRVPRGLSAI